MSGRAKIVLDEFEREVLYNLVAAGYTLDQCGKALGMTGPTLTRIRKEVPEVGEIWKAGKQFLQSRPQTKKN